MHCSTIGVLLLLWHSLATVVLGANCDVKAAEKANGCTTFGVDVPFQNRFTPSCNLHDICYFCGARFSVSRLTCDKDMRSNMKSSCSGLSLIEKWACKGSADTYYGVVRVAGGIFYRSSSPSWCGESWVTSCLP
ncbi:hypothetical protein BaRGS_00023473 [Batillaria attramentaria]|uniref:Uncharacterized protein n=1 Tax=Batillaria attramentaria TaxID=370345 RepID=A0ABD0KE07_9CAEN